MGAMVRPRFKVVSSHIHTSEKLHIQRRFPILERHTFSCPIWEDLQLRPWTLKYDPNQIIISCLNICRILPLLEQIHCSKGGQIAWNTFPDWHTVWEFPIALRALAAMPLHSPTASHCAIVLSAFKHNLAAVIMPNSLCTSLSLYAQYFSKIGWRAFYSYMSCIVLL